MDCSPSGSSSHGVLQARILEWVAISYSMGSSRPRDWTHVSFVSCIKQVDSLPLVPPGKPRRKVQCNCLGLHTREARGSESEEMCWQKQKSELCGWEPRNAGSFWKLEKARSRFHVLTPRTCNYVILCGKRRFAGVINSSILRWKDYPENCQERSSVTAWVFIQGRQEGQSQRRCVDRSRNQSYVAGSQGMQAASGNWKRQGVDSFLEPPFFSFPFLKYLCVWLHRVLVAACSSTQTLSWIMWDLVPWPETEHGPPATGAWSLSHWTTKEVSCLLKEDGFWF